MPGGKSSGCVRGAHGRLLLSDDRGCLQSIDWRIEDVGVRTTLKGEILRARLLPAMRRRARVGRG